MPHTSRRWHDGSGVDHASPPGPRQAVRPSEGRSDLGDQLERIIDADGYVDGIPWDGLGMVLGTWPSLGPCHPRNHDCFREVVSPKEQESRVKIEKRCIY